jgi:uncharacterized protein HemX
MHDQRDSGAAVVVAVAAVLALVLAIAVVGVGYFWLRNSQMAALEQRRVAEKQRAVAEEQRRLVEEHRVRSNRDLSDAAHLAERGRRQFETAKQQANLVQQQLDETRRTWREILLRTDGTLMQEDTQQMEKAFMLLQERVKQMDEVFQ